MAGEPNLNTYRVVFRWSTVVEEELIVAKSMVGAAKKARDLNQHRYPAVGGWSVYSITLQ
jgi:hypothetical protein